jgi:TolB protein
MIRIFLRLMRLISGSKDGSLACLLMILLVCPTAQGEETAPSSAEQYVAIGPAQRKRPILALPKTLTRTPWAESLGKNLLETVERDLQFVSLFRFQERAGFSDELQNAGIEPNTFPMSAWSALGTEYLVKTGLTFDPSDKTTVVDGYVYEVGSSKVMLSKRTVGKSSDITTLAHTLSNAIIEALTGNPGIFLTKIAMTCDKSGKKEIYFMNYDGTETKQLTHHKSLSFAPAWSPDGKKMAYSIVTRHTGNIKNIDLYEYDFVQQTLRLLSDRTGINSGAVYTPDGKNLLLTLSYQGSPAIYSLDLSTRALTRLTQSLGFDVDPNLSPDGKRFAFVSSRTGKPMVFAAEIDGKNPQRLTFAGRYNATPSWSPRNNKIAFAGWLDQSFDLFIMNPDGTHIERLTKNQGSNEDPHFSPDGQFLVFSSNRTGQKNIYVTNIDGSFVKRLTYGLGNCTSPKWSLSLSGTAPH